MDIPFKLPASISTVCLQPNWPNLKTFYESLRSVHPEIPLVILGTEAIQNAVLYSAWTNVTTVVDPNLSAYSLANECAVLESALLAFADSCVYSVFTSFSEPLRDINNNMELYLSKDADATQFWTRSHAVIDIIKRLDFLNAGVNSDYSVLQTAAQMFSSETFVD